MSFDLTVVPHEIFSNILSFLSLRTQIPVVSSVCSTWRHACLISLPVQYEYAQQRDFYPTLDYKAKLEQMRTEHNNIFNNDKTTVYDGDLVLGGTVASLLDITIDHLISNRKNNDDEVLLPHDGSFFPSAFFSTYQSFMTTEELLFLMFYQYHGMDPNRKLGLTFALEGWVRQHIPQILRHNEDLTDESVSLLQYLLNFIDTNMGSEGEDAIQFAIYLRGLTIKNAIEQEINKSLILRQLKCFPVDNSKYDYTEITQISVNEVAKQLTIREFSLIDKLEPHEFCGYPWRKERAPHKCPNLINKMSLSKNCRHGLQH
jgi:hypothetical protein